MGHRTVRIEEPRLKQTGHTNASTTVERANVPIVTHNDWSAKPRAKERIYRQLNTWYLDRTEQLTVLDMSAMRIILSAFFWP